MSSEQKIIDGDGHVVEDLASIVKYMPQEYVSRSFSEARGKNPFPPIDHLHSANRHITPPGAFANVGREGWELVSSFDTNMHQGVSRELVFFLKRPRGGTN